MKKKLVVFASVFIMGASGTALAAPGSFSDVPANHWAYKAITDLSKAGMIEGFGDGTFKGDKLMSRYEVAVVVARAMENESKANVGQKMIINSLKNEFADELKDINMRVTKLEQSQPTVKIGGDVRFRFYKNNGPTGTSAGVHDNDMNQLRVRVSLATEIDDKWSIKARFGAQNNFNKYNYGSTPGSLGSASGETEMDQGEITYKMDPNWSFIFGRSGMRLGTTGMISDCVFWDGATLKYSDSKFTGRALVYDVSKPIIAYTQMTVVNNTKVDSQNVHGVDLAYKFNPNVAVTATYLKSDNQRQYATTASGYGTTLPWDTIGVGAKVNLGNDIVLQAEGINNRAAYATADAPAEGKGFYTALNYKAINLKKPGTYSIGVHYSSLGKDTVNGAMSGLVAMNNKYGIKGWGLSYDYVVAKNAQLTVDFEHLSPYDKNVNKFNYNNEVAVILNFGF